MYVSRFALLYGFCIGFRDSGLKLKVQGLGYGLSGFRIEGWGVVAFGARALGFGFTWGLGFRIGV